MWQRAENTPAAAPASAAARACRCPPPPLQEHQRFSGKAHASGRRQVYTVTGLPEVEGERGAAAPPQKKNTHTRANSQRQTGTCCSLEQMAGRTHQGVAQRRCETCASHGQLAAQTLRALQPAIVPSKQASRQADSNEDEGGKHACMCGG